MRLPQHQHSDYEKSGLGKKILEIHVIIVYYDGEMRTSIAEQDQECVHRNSPSQESWIRHDGDTAAEITAAEITAEVERGLGS